MKRSSAYSSNISQRKLEEIRKKNQQVDEVAREQAEKEHKLSDLAGIHQHWIQLRDVDKKLGKRLRNELELKKEKMDEKFENAQLRI